MIISEKQIMQLMRFTAMASTVLANTTHREMSEKMNSLLNEVTDQQSAEIKEIPPEPVNPQKTDAVTIKEMK